MSKADHLAKLTDESGTITIAAIDHRGSLQSALHPENPQATSDEEIRAWKREMVELYKNEVSGLLIDPIYGQELIQTQAKCGWMLSMEKSGYRGGQQARKTELLPNWGVKQAKEAGADGVKLLLYYDPENRELAEQQLEIAQGVAEQCQREKVVFLLEPLSYRKSRDPYLVERIVDELKEIEVDVFKLEYPGDEERCRRISKMLKVPWVLLSAGAEYQQYMQQLRIACENGASGMAVGRAVWQELGIYHGVERNKFLRETALPRMRELVQIVNQKGNKVTS